MKQKKIKKAVKEISKGISKYSKELIRLFELREEAEFKNGNFKLGKKPKDYDGKIKKVETILSDLATIRTAIKKDNMSIKIFGTSENKSDIYPETRKVLKKSKIAIYCDGYGQFYIHDLDEINCT